MNEIDKAALALAIEAVRKESPSQCQRIDDRLAADEDWTDIGKSCAYHRQIVVLDLMPWQSPPCYADLGALREPFGDPRAARGAPSCCSGCCELGHVEVSNPIRGGNP